MKSFLKFTVLLGLVVGGRLSKPTHQNTATAASSRSAPSTEFISVNQRNNIRPAPARTRHPEPARTQVLSVFFK